MLCKSSDEYKDMQLPGSSQEGSADAHEADEARPSLTSQRKLLSCWFLWKAGCCSSLCPYKELFLVVLASPLVSVRRSFGLTSKTLKRNQLTELLNQSGVGGRGVSKSTAPLKETLDQATIQVNACRALLNEHNFCSYIEQRAAVKKRQCSPSVPSLSL